MARNPPARRSPAKPIKVVLCGIKEHNITDSAGLVTKQVPINTFSRLYKKMCGTAEEIQQLWPTLWRDEYDCCEKGKYENGSSKQLHLEGLKLEERKKLLSKNYWIPNGLQLRTRSLFNNTENGKTIFLSKDPQDCLLDKRMAGKVKGYFVGDEINSALTLMFFMKERFQKRWDFKNENWVKIVSPG